MFPTNFLVGACVLLLLTFFIGIIGNLLVCLAVRNSMSMRTPTNLILLNLAVADFFGCLVNMPIMFFIFWTNLDHHSIEVLGEAHFVLTVLIGVAVSFCHVLLCVDRYDAIKAPFHRRITKNRMRKISLTLWLTSFAMCVLTIGLVIAVPTHWLTLQDTEPHYVAGEILNGVGSFVILAILAMMIFSSCTVRRGINAHNNNMINSLGRATLDREMRITKVTAVLITGFTITCLPWVFFRLLYDITGHQDSTSYVISYVFLYASHAINPLVYAGLMKNFQRAMKDSLEYCLSKLCCGLAFRRARSNERINEEGTSLKALQRSVPSIATVHPLAAESLNTGCQGVNHLPENSAIK